MFKFFFVSTQKLITDYKNVFNPPKGKYSSDNHEQRLTELDSVKYFYESWDIWATIETLIENIPSLRNKTKVDIIQLPLRQFLGDWLMHIDQRRMERDQQKEINKIQEEEMKKNRVKNRRR